MNLLTIAKVAYNIIMVVPTVERLFNAIQDLYYNNYFKGLEEDLNDYKGRRRAISNAIESAKSNEDRKHLSIMLAELYQLPSAKRREDDGEA